VNVTSDHAVVLLQSIKKISRKILEAGKSVWRIFYVASNEISVFCRFRVRTFRCKRCRSVSDGYLEGAEQSRVQTRSASPVRPTNSHLRITPTQPYSPVFIGQDPDRKSFQNAHPRITSNLQRKQYILKVFIRQGIRVLRV
jgi:hypothetical protein